MVPNIATPRESHCQYLPGDRPTLGAPAGRGGIGKEHMVSNGVYHSPLREPQFHETVKIVEQTHDAGVWALCVVARDMCTGNGACTHTMFKLCVESHRRKKYETKDRELEDLKAKMMWAVEITTFMGRLFINGEVRSLEDTKEKASPNI